MNPKYTTEPTNITHLEADVNYTVVYRECGSKQLVSYTLKRFEESLSDNVSFVRIHKKFLVNKNFIHEVMPLKVVMLSGKVLPLARRRKI
jgi:DNA-binding LytR/AlgR family response regulator